MTFSIYLKYKIEELTKGIKHLPNLFTNYSFYKSFFTACIIILGYHFVYTHSQYVLYYILISSTGLITSIVMKDYRKGYHMFWYRQKYKDMIRSETDDKRTDQ